MLIYRSQCDGIKQACRHCYIPDSHHHEPHAKTAKGQGNQEIQSLQRAKRYLEVDNDLLRHRNIWLLDLEEENNSLREKNRWVTANEQMIKDFQCEQKWDKYWEEENDSLREENRYIEKILSSLKDDGQAVEIISRLKRGESHQAIAEWLGRLLVGSDTQNLSPASKDHTKASSPADSGGKEVEANAPGNLQGITHLDIEMGTSSQVGHVNL